MTMEFWCSGCGRHFYIYGLEERAFNDRFHADLFLRSRGYKPKLPNAWKVVQDRARCCSNPNISIVKWEC